MNWLVNAATALLSILAVREVLGMLADMLVALNSI